MAKKEFSYDLMDGMCIIHEGVTEIPEKAFEKCKELTFVHIPEGVKVIGQYAFSQCENLREVVLPSTLEVIKNGAFWFGNKIERFEIPESVKDIEHAALPCNIYELVIRLKDPKSAGWEYGYPKLIRQLYLIGDSEKITRIVVPKGCFDKFRGAIDMQYPLGIMDSMLIRNNAKKEKFESEQAYCNYRKDCDKTAKRVQRRLLGALKDEAGDSDHSRRIAKYLEIKEFEENRELLHKKESSGLSWRKAALWILWIIALMLLGMAVE